MQQTQAIQDPSIEITSFLNDSGCGDSCKGSATSAVGLQEFFELADFAHDFAVDAGGGNQTQEVACGGEGVFGVDREVGVAGEVEVASGGRGGGVSGDVRAAGVVGAVGRARGASEGGVGSQ